MPEEKIIPALVIGGQANAGPPLGPALAPMGMNVVAIVSEINEKTKEYTGMRVPIKIIVNVENKTFSITVGIPTSSALLAKESGIKKGSGTPNTENIGNLTMDQLVKIANVKIPIFKPIPPPLLSYEWATERGVNLTTHERHIQGCFWKIIQIL